jgi:2-polyprenyl-6-methoxyphenol hydroxylase-like FAD-dependent oxidoreductase
LKTQIVIVGGSLGGLMAANLLLRQGLDVVVLEKSRSSLDGRGAGIVTHSSLIKTLEQCGVKIDDSLGVKVESRVVLAQDGSELGSQDYPQVLTSWSRLYNLLLNALPAERLRFDTHVSHVTQDVEKVIVHCNNGIQFESEILVAADGIRSTIRAQLAPHVPQYAGYVAWRGICDEASLSQYTLSTLFGKFGFGLPAAEQMLGYPVAGPGNNTAQGKRCYNFVWYRPANDAVLEKLMTDADGIHHPGGIAPHKVHWQAIATMRLEGQKLLAPQFAEVLQKTAQPFLQPIFDLQSTQLAFGRITLLGDAAFVARPHVGMGVTKAGDDASALAAAIGSLGTTPAALKSFEALRLGLGTKVVERGRELGAYMQAQVQSPRSAEKVMRETAIDLSLIQPEQIFA